MVKVFYGTMVASCENFGRARWWTVERGGVPDEINIRTDTITYSTLVRPDLPKRPRRRMETR